MVAYKYHETIEITLYFKEIEYSIDIMHVPTYLKLYVCCIVELAWTHMYHAQDPADTNRKKSCVCALVYEKQCGNFISRDQTWRMVKNKNEMLMFIHRFRRD